MKSLTQVVPVMLLLVVVAGLPASDRKSYQAIDKHALAAPTEVERTIPNLARYLVKPARNETEKVRAICRWIADRINYDNDLKDRALRAYAAGKYPPELVKMVRAENVLRVRKTVCEGYANLFVSLCKQAGVKAVSIGGNARRFKGGHRWNAVKLGAKWQLLDLTGMAAASPAGPKAPKPFYEFYFLTPPDQFIFFYRPTDPKWQLLRPPISKQEFERTPLVDVQLFQHGFSAREVRGKLKEKRFRGFVAAGFLNGKAISIRKAPLDRHLRAGGEYVFRVESADYVEIAIRNEGQYKVLQRQGNLYEGKITAQRGTLTVGGKTTENGKDVLHGMLQYVVE